jgi:hypothetical protein
MGPWAMRRHPIIMETAPASRRRGVAAGAGNVWRGCHLRRGARQAEGMR